MKDLPYEMELATIQNNCQELETFINNLNY